MFLFNKLIRMDIGLGIALIFAFIIQGDLWKSFFEGVSAVFLLFSVFNHVAYYKKTRKLY